MMRRRDLLRSAVVASALSLVDLPAQEPPATGVSLDLLDELGEWPALGFYRSLAAGDPWPLPWAHAFRELYERTEVRVLPGCLLMPCEPVGHARARQPGRSMMESPDLRSAYIFGPESVSGLKISSVIAEERKRRFPHLAAGIDALVADLQHRHGRFQRHLHSTPDIGRIVAEGFVAISDDLARAKARPDRDARQRHLLAACTIYAGAVRTWHARIGMALAAAAAQRPELARIAQAWPSAFLQPATTFTEGILAVTMTTQLDGVDSLGRFDQYLGTLYDAEPDRAWADALIEDFWRLIDRYNGWNLQLGGRRADGCDGCNALTRTCLRITGTLRLSKPSVSLRITADTPQDVWDAATACLATGCGHPALYNDEAFLPSLTNVLGVAPAEAIEYGLGGCTETLINGRTHIGAFGRRPDLVVARALLWAVHDGAEAPGGARVGLATGRLADHADWPSFLAALRQQVVHWADRFTTSASADVRERTGLGDPMIHRTVLVHGGIGRAQGFLDGGADHVWYYVNCLGLSTLIDGAAAIRTLVYEQRRITAEALETALGRDFAEDDELLRELRRAPRFGNDIEAVDSLGAELVGLAWQRLLDTPHPLGGRYVPSVIPWAVYDTYGKKLPATPDGRRAGAPLGDSVGAFQGRDTQGPTALLNSVSRLPLHLAVSTPVCNLRLTPDFLRGRGAQALIQAFFNRGGMQLQISAVDAEALRLAQQHPEDHRHILVRIGGYSEHFTGLSRAMQDSIIARTAHAPS